METWRPPSVMDPTSEKFAFSQTPDGLPGNSMLSCEAPGCPPVQAFHSDCATTSPQDREGVTVYVYGFMELVCSTLISVYLDAK